MTYIVN